MSLKSFFARFKSKITKRSKQEDSITVASKEVFCMNTEILNRVTSWIRATGWKHEDFATILRLVGLKTPIYLNNFSFLENSFTGTTENGEKTIIALNSAKFLDRGSEIVLIKGNKTKKYRVLPNLSKENKPVVFLNEEIIEEENGQIHNNYSNGKSILFFPNEYKLEIVISSSSQIPNINLWQKKVEWFLVSLLEDSSYLDISRIFSDLKDLLSLSNEKIKNIYEFSISLTKIIDKSEIVKSKILLKKGVLQEYASLEENETFHLWRNGDWKFFSDRGEIIVNIIMYNNEENRYYFTTTGTEKSILCEDLEKLFTRVKGRISSLRKEFF